MDHRNPSSKPTPSQDQRAIKTKHNPTAPVSAEAELGSTEIVSAEFDDELLLQPLEDLSGIERDRSSLPDLLAATTLAESLVAARPIASPVLESAAASGHAVVQSEQDASEENQLKQHGHRNYLGVAAPSWLVSLLVHVGIIVILAAITLDPIEKVLSILQAGAAREADAIEQFDIQSPELDTTETQDEPFSPTTEISEVVEMPELATAMLPVLETSVDALDTNRLTESIIPSSMLSSAAMSQMAASLNSRSSASKSEMLERYGGNAASEKAVAMALKWIADHQASNGGWTFAHSAICRNKCDGQGDLATATNAATAMALLPFLGAGQTHMEGQYKETVHKGLAFLINRMKVTSGGLPQGSWHEPGGRMYSHGLAAITMCEAYAMTRDPDLLQPAQLSLNYLIASQDPRGGGWRYEPGQAGDTSVVGWCVMALKSGKMGNLVVPEKTFRGIESFLDMVSTNNGAYYGYNQPTSRLDGRNATIAVGLLCRMYMGWPQEHPGLQEGIAHLSKVGPRKDDLYYSYYGTQVLRHQGGPAWEKWNKKMRDDLVGSQESKGHAAGSWLSSGRHAEKGGRLYATSLATMILEVYYRHMPLYSEKSSADDFEI